MQGMQGMQVGNFLKHSPLKDHSRMSGSGGRYIEPKSLKHM